MQCPACQQEIEQAPLALCPHCGASLQEEDAPTSPSAQNRPHSRLWIRLLLGLLAIALFVGVIAAGAYGGIYAGERERAARRAALIEQHYDAGIEALNAGRYERAVAEFSYVIEVDPHHDLAEEGLAEARARLEVKPTPTLEAAQSLVEQLLDQAKASYAEEDWVSTARTLTQLRALDPAYEQTDVEEMLFTSLYRAGQAFLAQDQLESGISYLDQAIALRPLDADVAAQRNLAARYLDALNYWGVDWELAIERFETLYGTAPNYKDVAERLYRAHIEFGDYFADQGDMCPAELEYTAALRIYTEPRLEQKRTDAAQVCIAATPVAISGTMPSLTPQPIQGFSVGRLAYPIYNATTGGYDLNALYADGRIIRVASQADQPWWEWNTGRLAYRDRVNGGIKLVLPEEGVPLQLLSAGRQAWPTLSPDSQRIAYAEPDPEGVWYIYIANTDGTGEPRQLAAGWSPAWSRSGLLAYTGCDAGGCGIILDNPDDDQPGGRLTGSENDVAISWAAGGNILAYMGNVAGNWDIFSLDPSGNIQQLTTDAADDGLPVWSPDGTQLAFVSNRGGTSWGIYILDLSTQTTTRIIDLGVELPGWESQRLSWAP